jgi:FlaA1/EpsC-like NDP-sugar epimerase
MMLTTLSRNRARAERAYVALIRHRFILQAFADGVAWALALLLAGLARFEFQGISDDGLWPFAIATLGAAALQLGFGTMQGLYLGRWRIGSIEEATSLARTVGLTGLCVAAIDVRWRLLPLSVALVAPAVALVIISALRLLWRLSWERSRRSDSADAKRVIIYGAGEGGRQMIMSMRLDSAGRYLPVALLDDDPRKANLRIYGVPVLGTLGDLGRVAEAHNSNALLVAIPSASSALLREVAPRAAQAGLEVSVLPSMSELFGRVGVSDIRAIDVRDLLGRREIDTDVASIAHYLSGKRVLVTGAGGSIGSELCRQVMQFSPEALIMLDRDESALHAVQLSIEGSALLDSDNLVVCDIRDREALESVFASHRPHVVFHAAALKHLPLLERHPSEGLKTNVWGTQNVLDFSARTGVERFVNISTDKAADPSSVLGYTKRIGERLTAAASAYADGEYLSVRFGNVLGSRGSVLTSFTDQIARGGPVTVTHPDVTRYFMTVEESVQLVIQAGAIGSAGDVLVLDMGEPVRIADVCRQMIDQSSNAADIEVVFTGLRPGEKLQETLLGVNEVGITDAHPMIMRVATPPIDPSSVHLVHSHRDPAELIIGLAALATQPAISASSTSTD